MNDRDVPLRRWHGVIVHRLAAFVVRIPAPRERILEGMSARFRAAER